MLAVYSYAAKIYYKDNKSLYIHRPRANLSTAENILHMLRPDNKFSPLEAQILDLALVLHAEHGGGNNSTFTTHVVTSSGTDTYAAISAAISSLKGPKHGGANIKVMQMFADIKKNVKDWSNEEELTEYIEKILHKEAFDKAADVMSKEIVDDTDTTKDALVRSLEAILFCSALKRRLFGKENKDEADNN